jgi:uncharacterized protein
MEKLSKLIVKWRHAILILGILLLIPSAIGYFNTRVNFDILTYLPSQIDTMKGQEILKDEFGTGAYTMIVCEGMEEKDVSAMREKIESVNHVKQVLWYDSVADLSIPTDVLPDEVKDTFINGDSTLMFVTFDTSISSDETMQAIEDIRNISNEQTFISGMSAIVTDTKNLTNSEQPIYVLIAVILAIFVLGLTMDSWMIPIFFLVSIGMAIVYNMGSNIFLGEVSYITKAIAAILQLGVTMDYSIFLWHSFTEQMDLNGGDDEKAMAKAIEMTFSSVVGSSVTTIAGFIALCFMSFTLGMDLGIVMAKGVLIGVICCVTILPSMIMIFSKLTMKTMHKPFLPQFKISKFVVKHYVPIVVIFFLLWIPAIYGYQNMQVYYKMDSSLPDTLPSIVATNELDDKFSLGAVDIILADADLSSKDGSAMCKELQSVDGVQNVLGLDSVIGPALLRDVIPDDALSDIKSDNYQLILVTSEYQVATDEMNNQCEELEEVIKKYDSSAMLIGEGPCTKDLIKITDQDFKSVSFASIGIIFVIILLVFGSISIPVILIFVIEFAVYLNMSLAFYTGTTLPFIASVVIGTVQLGSTVDYAILMTNRYKRERINGVSKKEAVIRAHETSTQSIIISALSFFAATIGVGVYSNIDMVASLCMLMARGAIVSMITVLLVLPAMLMIFDKLICKTTRKMTHIGKKKASLKAEE